MIEPRTAFGGMMGRRGVLGGALAGLGGLALPRWSSAATLPGDRTFAIFRDGDEIGRHAVRFEPLAGGFRAVTQIDISVKMAFLTVFHFTQTAREVWIDGTLHESEAETDDDGEVTHTVMRAAGSALAVEGSAANRTIRVPLGTMTDLAFWNPEIVRQSVLVDTQKAVLTDMAARHLGAEKVEAEAGIVAAERYSVAAASGRRGDIWFDAAGNWVKGVMTTRGATLEYRLV